MYFNPWTQLLTCQWTGVERLLIKESSSCCHCHSSPGRLLVSCPSHSSGLLCLVRAPHVFVVTVSLHSLPVSQIPFIFTAPPVYWQKCSMCSLNKLLSTDCHRGSTKKSTKEKCRQTKSWCTVGSEEISPESHQVAEWWEVWVWIWMWIFFFSNKLLSSHLAHFTPLHSQNLTGRLQRLREGEMWRGCSPGSCRLGIRWIVHSCLTIGVNDFLLLSVFVTFDGLLHDFTLNRPAPQSLHGFRFDFVF